MSLKRNWLRDISYLPDELFGVEPTMNLTGTATSQTAQVVCPSGWIPCSQVPAGAGAVAESSDYRGCCKVTSISITPPPTNTSNTISPPATPIGPIGCTQVQTIALSGNLPPGPVTQEECSVCPDSAPFRCRYVYNGYVYDFCCNSPSAGNFPGYRGCAQKMVVITPPPPVIPPVTPPPVEPPVTPPVEPPVEPPVSSVEPPVSTQPVEPPWTGTGTTGPIPEQGGVPPVPGADVITGPGGVQPTPAVQKDFKPYILGGLAVAGFLGLIYFVNKKRGE